MSEGQGPGTESERHRASPPSDAPTPAQEDAHARHRRSQQQVQNEERAHGAASALEVWAQQQSPIGGFNAYCNRLVRHLEENGNDVLAALEEAHREALREVPTLADSINMASYAAASFVEGFLAATARNTSPESGK